MIVFILKYRLIAIVSNSVFLNNDYIENSLFLLNIKYTSYLISSNRYVPILKVRFLERLVIYTSSFIIEIKYSVKF